MEKAMKARLVWITPEADAQIAYCARVSNPANQDNKDIAKLLRYCAKNEHWSVFEMASACVEITTTRDIARQILRHRSFSFQELSQRYTSVHVLPEAQLRECRLQDEKNRQNSLPNEDLERSATWADKQEAVHSGALAVYNWALNNGIAKEVARAVLPEGLTSSRLYMAGTLRSWLTYLNTRLGNGTQKEHKEIAKDILAVLQSASPVVFSAFFDSHEARQEFR